jgi:hypothetical protein
MSKETKIMCPLGNGECPPNCKNYKAAKELTEALGDKFDPKQSRLAIIFGDAFSHDLNVLDIANTMTRCAKEKTKKIKPQ